MNAYYEEVRSKIDGLQEGQGLQMETPPVLPHYITPQEILDINKMSGVVHIITSFMRQNGGKFIDRLEMSEFPPEIALANNLFRLHIIMWHKVLWYVATIPASYAGVAAELAKKYNFVLNPTVPILIENGPVTVQISVSKDRKAMVPVDAHWFPVDTNTLTIEKRE